jgi:foldase protein PrsA
VLNHLIDQRLIAQAARRNRVAVTDSEVTAELEQIKSNFGSEGEFQALLVQRNLTIAQVRDLIRSNLTQRRLALKVSPIKVSDEELQRAFTQRRSQYDTPEQMHTSHILIKVESPEQDRAARQKLVLVQAKLRNGEKFADLARQYSDDPGSKERGGDLGWQSKGALVPEFEKAAMALEPGQISEPVKTTFGYHIILMHGKKAGRQATLQEVQARLREELSEERGETAFREWLKKERQTAEIKRFKRPAS